ncbi:MAG: rod shape-determining protein MreD [Ignavibacteria bacterium]
MRRNFSAVVLSLLLVLLQTTIVNVLTLGYAVPDLLILWIVVLAIRRGQVVATLYGFGIGVFLDLISGSDGMLGLSALSKSLAGFVAGYFYHENRIELTLSSVRLVVVVGSAALLHNAVYFLIFLRGSDVIWWRAVSEHGVPSTLYTTVLSVIPMAISRRKYQ